MPLYSFEGRRPRIGKTSFVHEEAVIIGKVTIGEGCYVAAGAVLRGDWGEIEVGDGSNIQENVVIHARPESVTRLAADSHVGHGAILHGCTLEKHVLVGMGAILNDDVSVGENVVIGSGALIPPRQQIPPGVLVVGVPAKIVKELTPEMMEYALWGTRLYQTLPGRYHATLEKISLEEATG
jgi:phenylacetic acid degradation protein